MTKSNKTILAVAAAMWLALGAVTATAAPVTTTAPPAMAPARPAARPVPRPVAMRPAARPAPKPAAMPVLTMAAAAPAAAMTAAPPVMALAPVMAAPEAAMAAVPEKAAAVPAVKKDTKGQVIGGWIVQVLLYLLGIFLTAFIPVFTAWLYKKFKLTDLEQKAKIDEIVLKATMFGIGKAEEAAYKLRDNPMDSAKKLDLAIASANKYLVDSGLPEKGAKYLADLIESKLGETREGDDKKPAAVAKPEKKPAEDEKPKDEPKEAAASADDE